MNRKHGAKAHWAKDEVERWEMSEIIVISFISHLFLASIFNGWERCQFGILRRLAAKSFTRICG